jgi:hypothetical protein
MLAGLATSPALSQKANVAAVKTVEVKGPRTEFAVGEQAQFTAVAKDEAGKVLDLKPSVWSAAPFDLAAPDANGIVTFYQPGEVTVFAFFGTRPGFTRVMVKPAAVATVAIEGVNSTIVVGGTLKLSATARTSGGDPRSGAVISWASDNPAIATVDAAGVVTGIAPGKTSLRAAAGTASGTINISVVKNTVRGLSVTPLTTNARTGDVVHFKAVADSASENFTPRWAVSGAGAAIDPDGGFVAEAPGTYLVTASIGERSANASIVVTPRNAERSLSVVGRAPLKDATRDTQGAEQWIIGNYAYYSTISDHFLVYDVSDPGKPVLTDTVKVDARLINDISTTADGKILVISREGSSSRKNGIAFYDTSDPAHPKPISEYTATVTGGVHSAFVDGHYVYLTDDATGSMRVVDFADVKNPKEVARWQVENQVASTLKDSSGMEEVHGRYLHDLQVKDGLAYLAYWRDGLIILDVGNGIKGGSPEKPQLVGQLHFNHNELYGNGWLAGTHSVFRYKNYVFVGDEVFPGSFDLASKIRIPVRGIMHVVDVSDLTHPRKVAEYPVPEAGAHNIWVENDILYMGYYNGGGRVLDVSGELRGDLYRQGRQIANLWTGDADGFRPNVPFCWGAQPHKGLVYFNDVHSGLWIVKLSDPIDQGSTTSPGQ